VREVSIDAFEISRHTVTNREFAAFVSATGHRSGAERFGWSFVFAAFLPAHLREGGAAARGGAVVVPGRGCGLARA